ncbi:hypothetical protein BABINDRAFT_162765 [Babjeviella inositovora NRRL Y-12698]|uniref:SAP domain-containing protein n=1 Tax=Babjeviella inositovora NRRL Y-12698 TaxID=984486 RepID=A0A1E3QLR4_9ASCO|nr:uncharacterized protein BABINDRAFT_162765 [Babjeviella inositovora NRRL Y-12698]ODQ78558.1 hypothetical protein BABINDRAFT_162765 [Babjeviella inositovora NRRL Y-12698]
MSEYSAKTVAQLKELLKARNLSTAGVKQELIQRLDAADSETVPAEAPVEAPAEVPAEVPVETPAEVPAPAAPVAEALAKEVPAPVEAEEKKEPKVLSADERKQLAIEFLTKKMKRAEKFGDDAGAEAAKKDLARVEKFGVETGTGLAREIGLTDRTLDEKTGGVKKNTNRNRQGAQGKRRNGGNFRRDRTD